MTTNTTMDKAASDEVCNRAKPGYRIRLKDGRVGKVVTSAAEHGSIWLLPDGDDQHDIRVWANAVADVGPNLA